MKNTESAIKSPPSTAPEANEPNHAPKKNGGLKRFAYFALALDSWKYSFTVPFRRSGAILQGAMDLIPRLFVRSDHISPAVTSKQIEITKKKTLNAFLIQSAFALFFCLNTVFISTTPTSIFINAVISLIFIFQAFVNLLIFQKAKSQTSPILKG